jgi:CAAX protease family protein
MAVDGPPSGDGPPPAAADAAPAAVETGAPAPLPLCARCSSWLRPGAAFCSACGQRVGEAVAEPPGDAAHRAGWIDVRRALVVYLILLGIQVVGMILHKLKVDTAPATVWQVIEPLFAGAVLVAAVVERREVLPLYRRAGFGPRGYLAIAALSYPIFCLVALFVAGLHHAFDLPDHELEDLLPLGTGWAIFLLSVSAPVTEELAFRGVIFAQLARALSVREAMVVSSFAFAILHLGIPVLVTHVPLGLYFCWLRVRGRSLWPGMFAHALHNGWVLVATLVPGVRPHF